MSSRDSEARTSGWASASTTARCRTAMTGSGVAAGTIITYSTSTSSAFRPDSAVVGTSGASGERARLVTARALILPASTWGSMPGVASTPACTSPDSTAITAGVLPL